MRGKRVNRNLAALSPGVLGKWSAEREAMWEREHRDDLATFARDELRRWSRTLSPRQQKSIGLPVRPIQRATRRR